MEKIKAYLKHNGAPLTIIAFKKHKLGNNVIIRGALVIEEESGNFDFLPISDITTKKPVIPIEYDEMMLHTKYVNKKPIGEIPEGNTYSFNKEKGKYECEYNGIIYDMEVSDIHVPDPETGKTTINTLWFEIVPVPTPPILKIAN